MDYFAPQWVDFTNPCSPIQVQDFFENPHMVHEHVENLCDSTSKNTENVENIENVKNTENTENTENTQSEDTQSMPQIDVTSTKAQADLDIIKSTPIKVVSPKHRNNKEVTTETTYDQVLSDAMRKLELCKKPKVRESLNKTNQELYAFKTPNMTKIAKLSRSVGCRSVPNKHVQPGQDSVAKSKKVNRNLCMANNDTSVNAKKTSVNHALLKQNENHNTSKSSNPVDNSKDKEKQNKKDDKECNKENTEEHEKDIEKFNEIDNKEYTEENNKELQDEESMNDDKKTPKGDNQDDVDAAIEKNNQTQSSSRHTVLTWYNHRRSLQKRRMSTNKKYISLAEAVSRFQNETPERFHTKSSKMNNMSMPLNISKLMQNRLKPTIPISPALVSKNRTRPVTVLSREEREKLEVEEMKKYQIKANPIPPNVLRGSRVAVKTVAKKSTTTPPNSTQSNEKACVTSVLPPKNPLPHRDKGSSSSKNVVTKVLVTDPSGIIVEHEEITFFGVPKNSGNSKNVTRTMPFSFEARNKDLQIKKEQRLKSLQEEVNKTKTEFHARPVPNFSKPPTPTGKQQQQNTKKSILPCPFSFDDRNRKAFERKEQLVKQILEEDKRGRVFRANPVPIFKPVMVRGRSKEHLLAKDKNMASEQVEDQENREPNVNSSKERENIPKSKNAVCTVDKQTAPLKAYPLKLNTDKRAKERYEFNEKMRRKEMDEEAKRQEAEQKKLESEKEMKIKLRKLTEVKARPMPVYKPMMIMKATKQLTNPQSPAFASKLRSKQT